ncbi:hypothetical protein BGZ59_002363 [Podila verticillata]|nr:hypothetical protein BGZ59_002363 [Podila verticillata]
MNTAERHHQLNHHLTKDPSTPSSKKRKASLTTPDRSHNSAGFSSGHSDSTISDTSITTTTTPTSKRVRKSAATDPLSPLVNINHGTASSEPTSTRTATTTTAPDSPSPTQSKPKRRSSATHKPPKNSLNLVGMGTINFNDDNILDDHRMNGGTSPVSSSPGSLSSSSSLSTATTGPPARPRASSHAHAAPEAPKRPARRNKRDSPQDSTLLGHPQDTPLVPAGGYIIYVSNNNSVLDKTTFDKGRVPPTTYGAVAPPTSQLSLNSPKPFVHIEVPIFKPCSIAQFQQDEKKRKMEVLSKALAKAEAKAAAEALALAASHEPIAPPPGARTVSTRLKHKEAVSHQQVSVVTATPGAHGKKSTTIVTTGAGSGTAAGSHLHNKKGEDEDLHDEVYEKRHRKQEMLERRIKNREKEKLRHAMYQQQQVVEKLRHMDINRLMPLSAFRTQHKKTASEEPSRSSVPVSQDESHGTGSSQISVAAAKIMQEEYHRRLIREAEESLRRFEQLGLAGEASTSLTDYSPFSRTKNRLLYFENDPEDAPESEESESEDEDEDLSDEPSPKPIVRRRKRIKTESSEEDQVSERRARSSPSTKTSPAPSSRKSQSSKTSITPVQPPRPPKPITTFIKPGTVLASGGRKSSRVVLAFGEKVPTLDRMDFDLPLDDVFGPLIRARLSARGETIPALSKVKATKGRISFQALVATAAAKAAKSLEDKDPDAEESSISSALSSKLSLPSDASSPVE